MIKECAGCSCVFHTCDKNTQYCSAKCMNSVIYEKECVDCLETFYGTKTSSLCYSCSKGNGHVYECATCGKTFQTKTKLTCCQQCLAIAYEKQKTEKKKKSMNVRRATTTCSKCGVRPCVEKTRCHVCVGKD